MPEPGRDLIDEVFKRALELPAGERQRFLDETGERDGPLRQAVERLLQSSENDDGSLLRPGGGASGPLWQALTRDYAATFHFEPGEQLGAYRIVRVLGRGGMATVYLAERADGLYKQMVALKVLDFSRDYDALTARFSQERRILARLEHPNIARLIDGGTTRSGQPYVVMEYVDGEPIDRYCDRCRLSVDARISLFAEVASAVQYAHGNLVVHRDIKPSNILVNAAGSPKLLDFGIAKLLDPDTVAPVTRSALHPMTPEYASPEQVLGGPLTTASDVYQLGYLLYCLLCGRSPYRVSNGSVAKTIRAICDTEPIRPSFTVAGSAGAVEGDDPATARSTTPERLRRRLSGDLDNILLMALHKDPARRYPSAFHLTDDLKRHVEGLPVAARSDTFAYRARKFIRRHAAGVTAAVIVVASLTTGFGVAVWQAQEKAREAANAEQVKNFVLSLFEEADPQKSQGETMTALDMLEQGSARVASELSGQPGTQADMYRMLGAVFMRLGVHDRALAELEKALEIRRSLNGQTDPRVADVLHMMAEAHGRSGDFGEAVGLYRQALEIRERRLGTKHPDVANTMIMLGEALTETDPTEGERLVRGAISTLRELYGTEHPRLAHAEENLGGLLKMRGDLEGAERHLREALRQERLLLGEQHSDVAVTLVSLAAVLTQKGKTADAETATREALAIHQRVFGDDHPTVANTFVGLAGALHNQGRFAEAAEAYRKAIEIFRGRLGDENARVAHGLLSLAASLSALEAYEEAEAALEEALPIFVKVSGEEHMLVAITLQVRGGVRYELGRLDAAEQDLLRARDLTRAIWGGEHFQMANVLYDYGKVLLARRREADAEATFRTVVDMRVKQYGEPHLFVADPVVWLGRSLLAQGRMADAEPLLLEGYAVLLEELGPNYKDVREARAALNELYTAWGKDGQAAAYR